MIVIKYWYSRLRGWNVLQTKNTTRGLRILRRLFKRKRFELDYNYDIGSYIVWFNKRSD